MTNVGDRPLNRRNPKTRRTTKAEPEAPTLGSLSGFGPLERIAEGDDDRTLAKAHAASVADQIAPKTADDDIADDIAAAEIDTADVHDSPVNNDPVDVDNVGDVEDVGDVATDAATTNAIDLTFIDNDAEVGGPAPIDTAPVDPAPADIAPVDIGARPADAAATSEDAPVEEHPAREVTDPDDVAIAPPPPPPHTSDINAEAITGRPEPTPPPPDDIDADAITRPEPTPPPPDDAEPTAASPESTEADEVPPTPNSDEARPLVVDAQTPVDSSAPKSTEPSEPDELDPVATPPEIASDPAQERELVGAGASPVAMLRSKTGAWPGLLRSLRSQFSHQNRLFFRSPLMAVFALVLPVSLLALLRVIYSDDLAVRWDENGTITFAQFYVPALAAFTAAQATYGSLAVNLATQRDRGVLKRIRATPLPPWLYLAGAVASAFFIAVLGAAIMVVAGNLFYGLDLEWSRMPAMVASFALGVATFAALGIALSTLIPGGAAAHTVAIASLLPVAFISDVFIPLFRPPRWLDLLGDLLPLKPFSESLQLGFANPTPNFGTGGPTGQPTIDLAKWAVLFAWLAVGLVVARLRFRWNERGR